MIGANKKLIIFVLFFVLVAAVVFIWQERGFSAFTAKKPTATPTTYSKSVEIIAGSTFGKLMADAEVSSVDSQAIFDAAKGVYDLSKIKSGQKLNLIYKIDTDELAQIIYQIDTEEELYVTASRVEKSVAAENTDTAATSENAPVWSAERKKIPYEIKIKTVEGTVDTSMYADALQQGIDERAIVGFAEAFQWTIDFAWEVQKGDSYKFVYEERYLNGQYAMPGQILAGRFTNQGKNFYAFYYKESDDNEGFFDENGESAEKMFLKTPVAFKYISSGYTTGLRYVEAFNVATGHRAVDYAAAYGSPIWSVGDGTVVFAGWNGPYGNMVKVRHNGTYQTNYGHMSKIAVRKGQVVKQGQTIGYVGSTGFSTGPHVHFEMEKNGVKINPLKEVLPPSKGIDDEGKNAYFAAISDLKNQLDKN